MPGNVLFITKLEEYISSGFFFYLLLILLLILAGVWHYRNLPMPYKLLTQFLGIIFLSETTGALLESRLGTNYPFYHMLLIVEFIYYGLIFYYLLSRQSLVSKVLAIMASLFGLTSLLVSIFYQSINTFPSIGSVLLSFYVVVATLVLFLKMIRSPIETPILKQGDFWFAVGNLFFHAITFFVFGYFKVIADQEGVVPAWSYDLIRMANFILYGCYLPCIYFASIQTRSGR